MRNSDFLRGGCYLAPICDPSPQFEINTSKLHPRRRNNQMKFG